MSVYMQKHQKRWEKRKSRSMSMRTQTWKRTKGRSQRSLFRRLQRLAASRLNRKYRQNQHAKLGLPLKSTLSLRQNLRQNCNPNPKLPPISNLERSHVRQMYTTMLTQTTRVTFSDIVISASERVICLRTCPS